MDASTVLPSTLDLLLVPDLQTQLPEAHIAPALDEALGIYADSGDVRVVAGLLEMYRRSIGSCELAERSERYLAVSKRVARGSYGVDALLPFWMAESHGPLVASAILDHLVMRPVQRVGSLAGTTDILNAVRARSVANRGAALSGLLLTGDTRVIERVRRHAPTLDTEIATELAATHSGILFAGVIDLYLDWMEQQADENQQAVFDCLAKGMVQMLASASPTQVLEVERNFGLRGDRPAARVTQRMDFTEYRDAVLPRIRSLADAVAGSVAMAQVVLAWRSTDAVH